MSKTLLFVQKHCYLFKNNIICSKTLLFAQKQYYLLIDLNIVVNILQRKPIIKGLKRQF